MDDEATQRITILLQAKDAEFQKQMKKTQAQFGRIMSKLENDTRRTTKRIDDHLQSLAGSATSFGKNFLAGFAVGAIGALLSSVSSDIRSVIGDIADMADAADRVGLSAESFQALQLGMKQAGVEAAEFSSAMEKFVGNIGDAARGNGELQAVLQANGIAVKNMAGEVRPTLDLLKDFADVIKRTPDEATQMSLIEDAFGRGGKAMVLAMSEGGRGIDDMMAKMIEAGLILDNSVAAKARDLDDRFDVLTAKVGTFFETLVINAAVAMGALDDLKKHMPQFAADSRLGHDLASSLEGSSELVEATADDLDKLNFVYDDLAQKVAFATEEIANQIPYLLEIGETDAALKLSDITGEMGALVDQVRAGKISATEFETKMNELGGTARDVLSDVARIDGVDMSGAVSAVDRVSESLRVAAGWAADLVTKMNAAAGISTPETVNAGPQEPGKRSSVVPQSPLAPNTSPRPKPAPNDPDFGIPDVSGRSGGGGGRGSNNAARWYEQTRTEAEKYAADLADLDRLLKQGAVSHDTYARGLELIREKYDLASDASKLMQDVGGSALDRLIDGTADLKEALVDMIKEFLKARLLQQLGGAPGSSLGSTIINSIVGGLAGKRANGGAVTAGKAYLVGENGPEPFIPQQSGAIVPHMKGGTNGVAVQVTGGDLVLTDSGQIAARIRVTAQQSGMMAVQSVRQQLPAWQRQLATDGTL